MIDGFCVAIKEDGGALKPCAPELFNVPKDVIHIGCAAENALVEVACKLN